MGKVKSMQLLKGVYHDIYDKNGNLRGQTLHSIIPESLEQNRLDFLESLLTLAIKTDYLSYESKYYIQNRDLSMSNVHRDLIEDNYYANHGLKELSEKGVITKLYRDQEKMDKELGQSVVVDALSKLRPIAQYTEALARAFTKAGSNDIKDNLIIELDSDVVTTEIGSDDFDMLVSLLEPYFKSKANELKDSLTEQQVGYLNYISGCPDEYLQPLDKSRKDRIRAVAGIQ